MLPRGSEWSRRGSIWMQLLVADTELEEGELARSCTLLHFAALGCSSAWEPGDQRPAPATRGSRGGGRI